MSCLIPFWLPGVMTNYVGCVVVSIFPSVVLCRAAWMGVCACVCVCMCVCMCVCVCVYVVGGWAQVGLYYCLFISISTSCTSVSSMRCLQQGGPSVPGSLFNSAFMGCLLSACSTLCHGSGGSGVLGSSLLMAWDPVGFTSVTFSWKFCLL